MPSSENYVRNYKEEYKNYQGKPEQVKNRASRNKARKTLEKSGRVRLGDGMDVDHRDHNPKNNSKQNLSVKSKSNNRSFKRNKNAGIKKV